MKNLIINLYLYSINYYFIYTLIYINLLDFFINNFIILFKKNNINLIKKIIIKPLLNNVRYFATNYNNYTDFAIFRL